MASVDLRCVRIKQYKRLAEKILNSSVEEDHILRCLNKIIECEEKRKNVILKTGENQQFSFEEYRYQNVKSKDVNLLHLAVSCSRDEVARKLNNIAPNLAKASRTDDEFKGQTPFHIAVAKGKHDLVEEMLCEDLKDERVELLKVKALGSALKGTKMMGETPLSIAVINCDAEMIQILFDNHADVMAGDTRGNTVMHTIVNYTYHFPEENQPNLKNQHFKRATQCLQQKLDKKNFRTLMHIQNAKGQTPLQLACIKGLDMVFDYFIKLDNIYKFNLGIWGVEDTYRYDITEIDTVHWNDLVSKDVSHQYSNIKLRSKTDEREYNEISDCCQPCKKHRKIHKQPSVLQAISRLAFKDGARFMSFDIIDEIICKKWDYYRWWFWGFGLLHLLIMTLLTWDAVAKTAALNLKVNTFGEQLGIRFLPLNGINIFVGLFYVLQEGVRKFLFRRPFPFHHDTIYRLLFLLFGLTLLTDSIWNFANPNNYTRYAALLFGWLGMIFFLRVMKYCSYHSMLFVEIITGDILKFMPVIIVTMVPFTAAAYESFGNATQSYPKAVLTLFQLMNGVGEMGDVEQETKPGLAITVFVLFIIFGNIILLQTLIALMANNHMNDISRWHLRRLQKLSVIVFFESILPRCFRRGFGEKVAFENSTGEKQTQYHLGVNRAHEDDYEEHRTSVMEILLYHMRLHRGVSGDVEGLESTDRTITSYGSPTATIHIE